MSETAMALAVLFAVGMMGTGLALFVKGAREQFDERRPRHPIGPRRPG